MDSHDDFAFEPQPGLPAPLPAGEHVLWQGKPRWKRLAIEAYHCRKLAIYFGIIAVFVLVSGVTDGDGYATIVDGVLLTLGLGSVAIAIVGTLAWTSARATIYTITNKRVLMRFGVALQLTINLPFSKIASADVRADDAGFGDLPLRLTDTSNVNYFVLWPHVRPRRLARPEPMLRALPDIHKVASLLANAVSAEQDIMSPASTDASATSDTVDPASNADQWPASTAPGSSGPVKANPQASGTLLASDA